MTNIFDRATKLRWRRKLRHRREQVEGIGVQAEEHLEQHFFKRLGRLASIRRFVAGWVALMVIVGGAVTYQINAMNRYYQTLQSVPGGMYTEGIVGMYTDANPIYASGAVDSAVSRLIFAGLVKYDQSGKLVGDLAESWSVDEKGTTYTFKLRNNLKWQDGAPLTAADVVFTYKTIQNPDAKSPLFGGWQGVSVAAPNGETVTFELSNALVSFPYSLTTGIIPKHLLASTPAAQLRSAVFNTSKPVGAGPFRLDSLEVIGDTPETRQGQVSLEPNEYYHLGVPKVDHFTVRTFISIDTMIDSFQRHELTAMNGLDDLTTSLQEDASMHEYSVTLNSEVGAFFKMSHPILAEQKVRQALVQSVDQAAVVRSLGYPVVLAKQPFLKNQFAYNPATTQLSFDKNQAMKLLDEAGWKLGNDGTRYKDKKQLTFQLYSQDTPEYAVMTKQLQESWKAVGVNVGVMLQSDTEMQKVISNHSYDALLYGINVGSDPDVFAYWHSSQAKTLSPNRFNFSEYKSAAVDKALEAARIRSDPTIRNVKYKPFLDSWRADAPALMLYQPRYLYLANASISGFEPTSMNDPTDRYANVHNWMIRTAKVTNK